MNKVEEIKNRLRGGAISKIKAVIDGVDLPYEFREIDSFNDLCLIGYNRELDNFLSINICELLIWIEGGNCDWNVDTLIKYIDSDELKKYKYKEKCNVLLKIKNIKNGEFDFAYIQALFRNLSIRNFKEEYFQIAVDNLSELIEWIESDSGNDYYNFVVKIETENFERRIFDSCNKHVLALKKKHRQCICVNDYGVEEGRDKWNRELFKYINNVVKISQYLPVDYNYYYGVIDYFLNSIKAEENIADIDVKDMAGNDFEMHCAVILESHGWSVRHNGRTGDQGVDLISEINGVRVAIQCKRYAGSVGNFAVQEIFAGQRYEACDAAVVVSNAKFTASAIQLAKSLNVHLIDITELPTLDIKIKEGK